MSDRTLVAAGELRPDLFALLAEALPADVLCAAPGLLTKPFAGHRAVALAPGGPLTAERARAFRSAMLETLAELLDRLPYEPGWARRIAATISALDAGQLTVGLNASRPDFARVICRPESSLLVPGPWSLDRADNPHPLAMELHAETHDRTRRWLADQLDVASDISGDVREVLAASWAAAPVTVRDLYHKVLYEYFSLTLHALDREADPNPMLAYLTDFQRDAYQQAKAMLRLYGGVFLADVVGLGKTWIAMALLRHLQERYDHHAVVVAPPAVLPAWEALSAQHRVELRLVSMGKLDDLWRYEDREVLVVDESHNFRNRGTLRYDTVEQWLRPHGEPASRQVVLLSATPQNNDARDVYHQLQLFPDNRARLPFTGEDLGEWFDQVRKRRAHLRDLLQHVVVRRTRGFIKRAYPDATLRRPDAAGQLVDVPLRFPERISGEEQVLRYQIDAEPDGSLYDAVVMTLGVLHYPLHGLGDYLRDDVAPEDRQGVLARNGRALRGLYRVLLLKRVESSLHAFRLSLERLRSRLTWGLEEVDGGRVPVLAHLDQNDLPPEDAENGDTPTRWPTSWFDMARLRTHLADDAQRVDELLRQCQRLAERPDPKLRRLERWFRRRDPRTHKTLIFTQFSDTATWLANALGGRFGRTEVVTGSTSGRREILGRFAPQAQGAGQAEPEHELDLLIATDALSEGVNLQDADTIVNFDLHWNPVRLIQRAGRVDRIGSEHDTIEVASFLPERGLEQHLGLEAVLRARVEEFLEVFGEDSRVLPSDELPDPEQMLAAYDGSALAASESEDDGLDGIAKHVNRILDLRTNDPEAYERIAALRPGRHAWSTRNDDGIAATRVGWFWQLWAVRRDGGVEPISILEGLDALYAHAEAGDAPEGNLEHTLAAAQTARERFVEPARTFLEQRQAPKLSAPERWALDQLEDVRDHVGPVRRDLVDELIGWIRSGVAQQVVRREARAWRKRGLAPTAVFAEVRSLFARFPGAPEDLGEPHVVGVVVSGSAK